MEILAPPKIGGTAHLTGRLYSVESFSSTLLEAL